MAMTLFITANLKLGTAHFDMSTPHLGSVDDALLAL